MKDFRTFLYTLSLLFIWGAQIQSQGYQIDVELRGFEHDSIFLAYYYADNQYIKDTAYTTNQSSFRFEGEETLQAGVYMIVLPPENEFYQVMINSDEQHIVISADVSDIHGTLKFKGSKDNDAFYDYLRFIKERSEEAESIGLEMKGASNETEGNTLRDKLESINEKVRLKQTEIIDNNPDFISSIVIGSNREVKIPEFTGSDEEVQFKKYEYYKANYFNNVNLSDPRIIYTPVVHERVDYYIEKLTYQTPDSINRSIDYLLNKLGEKSDGFKFYLVYFLNKYAQSKIVGMDAVYVHLVDNYYSKGKAHWIEEEQLKKIQKNADRIRPILIGKIAPNLTLYKEDGSPIKIHDLSTDYTVLFFWDPKCGHCEKQMPALLEFYENYKAKGVEIFGICTKTGEGEKDCWQKIKEKGLDKWLNTSDKLLRSRYKTIYDVQTTPQIFVLDKDKKIVFKRIGSDQLPGVIDHLIGLEGEGE